MRQQTLRQKLRSETADLHEVLDRQVGSFEGASDYLEYLRGTYMFRASVEGALNDIPSLGWSTCRLLPALTSDLSDFGIKLDVPVLCLNLNSPDAVGGALYVLEGSTLGAKILFRRAMDVGYGKSFGARHLAEQISEPDRWGRFQRWLEAANFQIEEAVKAARQVFSLALEVYAREGARS